MSRTTLSFAPSEKIIAVASGREGVGKTWLAVSLAHALTGLGERVLLLDGDLGHADVHAQLGVTGARHLGEVIAGALPMSEAVTRVEDAWRFDVIVGRFGLRGQAALPAKRLEALRSDIVALAGRYDRVLIDTCAGIDISAYGLIPRQASCLAVTTAEAEALRDTHAFLKVMSTEMPQVPIGIVISKAGSEIEGRQTYATLRRSCGPFQRIAPGLAGVIRHDPLICESIRARAPLAARHPHSEAAADVSALARALVPEPVGR